MLKNKKILLRVTNSNNEKANLDFEVARNFFIEMKYTIQNYLKKCGHVAFCEFRCRSCDYSAHALAYATVFVEKSFYY